MEVRSELPSNLVESIMRLKKEKKAVILAHNYQRPEVQEIADYVGDSVELSRRAMEEDAEIIVFSAVRFMAETAAILNPDKKVLVPSLGARCPMAHMLSAELLRAYKRAHPGVPVVLYVNTLAEAKAECDICCTSANAVQVVEALPSDTVLFGPDRNLAAYVQRRTGKQIIPVPDHGFCPVHMPFDKETVLALKEEHPRALVLAHPECRPEVQEIADFVGSSSQMCRFVRTSRAREFIVATEVGILYRMGKEGVRKTLIPAYEGAICPNMKVNTLEAIYRCLRDERYVVSVSRRVAVRAKEALMNMFEVTGLS